MNRTYFTKIGLAVLACLALALPARAQTALGYSTLSSAISSRDGQVFAITSTTGMNVKDLLLIDGEIAEVTAVTTGVANVKRGVQSTQARTHATGVPVWFGPPKSFSLNAPTGVCTAANETYLPRIVLPGGINGTGPDMYDCKSSEWVVLRRGGMRTQEFGRTDGGGTYTVLGAITIQPGLQLIGSGGALAMTLADPTVEQNGMIMILTASTAQAHTVTYTAGFGGGTTARDVATFGGAVNDSMTIIAFNKVWWLISTRNVTLG